MNVFLNKYEFILGSNFSKAKCFKYFVIRLKPLVHWFMNNSTVTYHFDWTFKNVYSSNIIWCILIFWKYKVVCSTIISKNSSVTINLNISMGSVITAAEILGYSSKKPPFHPPNCWVFWPFDLCILNCRFFSFLSSYPGEYLRVFFLRILQSDKKLQELQFLQQLY